MSELFKAKTITAVLSTDTDYLCYGVETLITSIYNGFCEIINLFTILEILNLSHLEFVNLCVLCGCDFNDNIPLIGPIKGFALIEKYRTIDKIKEAIGISPENYERSIQIFTVLEEGLIEKA